MQSGNPLVQIVEGMRVFDRLNHEIGTVERVQMGDDDPSTPEVESMTVQDPSTRRDTILDNIADVFRTDGLPEEVKERLLQQGFVRIDANGLFASDRYVTPDQIASVSSEGVVLGVSRDELAKRS